MVLKRLLVGNPLKTTQAAEERLPKRLALAVFSSNALSSVAYATEEILLVLVLAASAAMVWTIPVSLAIVLLLAFLTVSYRQIIYEYPEGGGAYTVAKSNFGELPGLTAAAVLMIDYVLTAAVSVAAGIAALTSAIPSLFPYRVSFGVLAVLLRLIPPIFLFQSFIHPCQFIDQLFVIMQIDRSLEGGQGLVVEGIHQARPVFPCGKLLQLSLVQLIKALDHIGCGAVFCELS